MDRAGGLLGGGLWSLISALLSSIKGVVLGAVGAAIVHYAVRKYLAGACVAASGWLARWFSWLC